LRYGFILFGKYGEEPCAVFVAIVSVNFPFLQQIPEIISLEREKVYFGLIVFDVSVHDWLALLLLGLG
jgi:hypothetical protein